ncbi:MAG: hypothetical protein A2293_12895 [Elusimicrobia bacterium RIFOXYB2_FULL_49_7]|nr:MAG: hypothetical protein A2293_12895 [Elusimicrobia bacterium RIFOXYB2_FULL_49_7]
MILEMEETGKPTATSIIDRESLGEYLRKIRIGNRIDITKMASDTKLSVDFITAIEKNDFGRIPGETYRKIFIKSIAKYLELNPEETYQRYLKETQPKPIQPLPPSLSAISPTIPSPAPSNPIANPTEAAASTHPDMLPGQTSPKTIALVLGVIALIFAILMITQKKGAATSMTAADSLAMENGEDSVVSEVHPAYLETDSGAITSSFTEETMGTLKVKISSESDSLTLTAFRNGRMWTRSFNKGMTKIFASDTALYFFLSGDIKVRFQLNNDVLRFDPKWGRYIRIAPGGVTYITKENWNTITAAP